MKFTATVIAASVVAVTAFTPATTSVRSTALQGHVLAGYKPIAPAAAPSTGGIPGFSGFGHATGQATAAATPAPAPVVKAEPIFSGFGHATGQMGGNPSIMSAAAAAPAKKTATSAASYLSSL